MSRGRRIDVELVGEGAERVTVNALADCTGCTRHRVRGDCLRHAAELNSTFTPERQTSAKPRVEISYVGNTSQAAAALARIVNEWERFGARIRWRRQSISWCVRPVGPVRAWTAWLAIATLTIAIAVSVLTGGGSS